MIADARVSPNLRPLDDRLTIYPDEAEKATPGGIVIPDTSKEKPTRGTVVSVGPGKLLDDGSRAKMSVQPGDVVLYGKYSGTEIEVGGKTLKVVRESDVLAKVESAGE